MRHRAAAVFPQPTLNGSSACGWRGRAAALEVSLEKNIEGPYYGTAPIQGSPAHPAGGPGGAGPPETYTNNGNGTNPFNGTDTYNSTIVFGGVGNGGGGGWNAPAPGPGGAGGSSGHGGTGHAYTHTRVNTSAATVFAYATGDGGSSGEAGVPGDAGTTFVGPGDSGGAGGNGVASAYAKNTLGQARALGKTVRIELVEAT